MHSKQYYCNWSCKNRFAIFLLFDNDEKLLIRGRVEDTQLEAKAKDTKKNPRPRPRAALPRKTLSRPRTGMLEGKAKDTGASVLQKKKKRSTKKFFRQYPTLKRSQNFWLGGPNYKSHAMTSSKIFKPGTFRGTKIS